MKRIMFLLLMLATVADISVATRDACAIIGRPLTPMSYAGVARRTTRRAVYAGAAGYGAAYAPPPVYAAPPVYGAPVYAPPPAAAYW